MKKIVYFKENGDEYTGTLSVECETFEKVDDCTIKVNGATIVIDEDITDIEDAVEKEGEQ